MQHGALGRVCSAMPSTGAWVTPAPGSPPAHGLGWEAPSGFSIPRGGRTPAPSWQMFIPSGPEPPLMVCQCLLRHRRARCQKCFSHA